MSCFSNNIRALVALTVLAALLSIVASPQSGGNANANAISRVGGYDGSGNQVFKTVSAANQTAAIAAGSLLTERGPRWAINNESNVSTAATTTKAAGAAGVRHVADCIAYGASAISAPTATAIFARLRDGATGAGTVLGTYIIGIPATAGFNSNFAVCGLNAVGSAATAMTLEFNAGPTNVFETVDLTGYDIQ